MKIFLTLYAAVIMNAGKYYMLMSNLYAFSDLFLYMYTIYMM